MALDDRLNALQSLEVGNVEKAIAGIEKAKLEREAAAEKFTEEVRSYKEAVEEKLPRIIDNIALMGRVIADLGEYNNPFHPREIVIRRNSGKKYQGGFNLTRLIDCTWPGEEFCIRFDKEASLAGIFLLEERRKREHWYSIKKRDFKWIPWIHAKTSEEFTQGYLKVVIPDIQKWGDSQLIGLPAILNGIPDEIKKAYEQVKSEEQGNLGKIQSHNGKLKGLDVSDFS